MNHGKPFHDYTHKLSCVTPKPEFYRCKKKKVLSFKRRNLFILNKFLISDKILITCRELYFEEVGHVYLIRMGYFPENGIFTVKDHVQNDTYS